jgi:hypothetical protein
MAAFNKFNSFVEAMGRKAHNMNADVLKIMLTNVAPVATNAVKADLTDITAQNGYTAGGTAVGANAYSQTSGTGKLTGNDVVFTATAGGFGPFRYAALYNDTATNKELIGWWDYGSSISLVNAGETFTVDLDQAAGILTVT